ncbi:MAG: hypothetical protein ABSG40_11525 [Terriglobales bacterium]|jgi:hypothetical protein
MDSVQTTFAYYRWTMRVSCPRVWVVQVTDVDPPGQLAKRDFAKRSQQVICYQQHSISFYADFFGMNREPDTGA